MKWFLTLGCLIVFGVCAQGQESLSGRVVDADNAQPIPFATVRLKKVMMGVISNAQGDFVIPARVKELGDTLVISCIGYVTIQVRLSSFGSGTTVLPMKPSVTELAPLTITARNRKSKQRQGLTAYRLVRDAIARIPVNYPSGKYSYIGYYRDYQTKKDDYLNLNEAIVEVRDGGFGTDDQMKTEVSLLQYRANTDFPRDSTSEAPYDNNPATFYRDRNKYIPNAVLAPMGGNELEILRLHDAIRNYDVRTFSYVNIFNKNFIENHSFRMEEPVLLDTVRLYCVSFESNYAASGPRNFAKGRIYISSRDLAIHKLEYSVYNKTTRELQLMYDIQVEYAKVNSLMYLNYVSFNNYFKTQNEREFRVIDFVYDRSINAMVLKFNSPPELSSGLDRKNYNFRFRDQPIGIVRIAASADTKTDLVVYLEESMRGRLETALRNSPSDLHFDVENVRDIDNRELDKIINTTLFQFRELFVQTLSLDPDESPALPTIDRNSPLRTNHPVHASDGQYGYWMNTPLKTKAGN